MPFPKKWRRLQPAIKADSQTRRPATESFAPVFGIVAPPKFTVAKGTERENNRRGRERERERETIGQEVIRANATRS